MQNERFSICYYVIQPEIQVTKDSLAEEIPNVDFSNMKWHRDLKKQPVKPFLKCGCGEIYTMRLKKDIH